MRGWSGTRVLLGVALAIALLYAPRDARSLWRDARNGQATPRATRAIDPALSVGILDPAAVVAAGRFIPRHDTYYVTVGPKAPARTPDALAYVGPWAALNLLPRRATPRPDQAQWILSYGGDLGSLGLRYGRVIRLAQGVQLAKVAR